MKTLDLFASLKSLKILVRICIRIVSQTDASEDTDPHTYQNVTDPEQCYLSVWTLSKTSHRLANAAKKSGRIRKDLPSELDATAAIAAHLFFDLVQRYHRPRVIGPPPPL